MNFLKKIKSIIRIGYISNVSKDTTKIQQAQLSYYDQVKEMPVLSLYGISYNAPINTVSLVVQIDGDKSNTIAIPLSNSNRFMPLKSGEVQIGNYLTGDSVKFTEDGKIIVNSSSEVEVTAPTIKVNGNLEVSGDITSSGNVSATGTVEGATVSTTAGIDLGTHTHYVASAPGNSSPPQ